MTTDVHRLEKERELDVSYSSHHPMLGSYPHDLSKPSYFLKPAPNTILLGIKASACALGGHKLELASLLGLSSVLFAGSEFVDVESEAWSQ